MTKKQIIKILKEGGIGILPTDTLYGLVGLALNQKTVERIYEVRKRRPDKPLIVLIGSLKDLGLFGVKPDKKTQEILKQYWPGKVSIILPISTNSTPSNSPFVKGEDLAYLHRGTGTIAFRLPKNKALLEILKATGPLVAPSANPEGLEPAKNIREAKGYFGDQADFYLTGKMRASQPSTLIEIIDGQVRVIRTGSVRIKI